MGAVGGAVGGVAGFGLGSILGGVGGGMAGRAAAGFVEGGLSDADSRMAMNALVGCAWTDGLWSAFIGGGLGGGVGGAIAKLAQPSTKKLASNITRQIKSASIPYNAPPPYLPFPEESGYAIWFEMGVNNVGTTTFDL